MLNKELLLSSGESAPHILMTVGWLSNQHFGWDSIADNKFGTLNRVPSWNINSYVYRLTSLSYGGVMVKHTKCTLSSNQGTFPSPWYLTVSIDGTSHTFELDSEGFSHIKGDIFGLQNKGGQTLAVTFDPQPDGYI